MTAQDMRNRCDDFLNRPPHKFYTQESVEIRDALKFRINELESALRQVKMMILMPPQSIAPSHHTKAIIGTIDAALGQPGGEGGESE